MAGKQGLNVGRRGHNNVPLDKGRRPRPIPCFCVAPKGCTPALRPLSTTLQFPANWQIIRQFLEISRDCGLLARVWEPAAKWIQQLAANSLFLPEPRTFLPEQGVRRAEQGICRVKRRLYWCDKAAGLGGIVQ